MTKSIYLAGPIADCTLGEATFWRDYVTGRLADNLVGISPMREKGAEVAPDGKIPGNPDQFKDTLMSNGRAIYTRDRYDCTHASGLLVYLPRSFNERRPSYGTAIEIGWASGANIPIVLVSDDDYLVNHPIVSGCVGWIVDDLDKGVEAINKIFGAYAPKVVAKPEPTRVDRHQENYSLQARLHNRPPVPTPYPGPYTERYYGDTGGNVERMGATVAVPNRYEFTRIENPYVRIPEVQADVEVAQPDTGNGAAN